MSVSVCCPSASTCSACVKCFAWNNKIQGGRQLKFLQPLIPGDEINFRLQYKEEGEASFTLYKAKLPASKGKLVLTHS
jgi:3-hydroxymyristoyl/3-hydroxydecanoyl-(acyl carrier protein) dehydratase